jgi:hypothetical protein
VQVVVVAAGRIGNRLLGVGEFPLEGAQRRVEFAVQVEPFLGAAVVEEVLSAEAPQGVVRFFIFLDDPDSLFRIMRNGII